MLYAALNLAEGPASGWDWFAVDAQIVLSNYGLVIVTTLATIIEIYKLTQIEHQLKLITKMIRAIRQPLRTRRIIAKRREHKIAKQAARNHLTMPEAKIKAEEIKHQHERVMYVNNGHHF